MVIAIAAPEMVLVCLPIIDILFHMYERRYTDVRDVTLIMFLKIDKKSMSISTIHLIMDIKHLQRSM
jgi:hypothetical protein